MLKKFTIESLYPIDKFDAFYKQEQLFFNENAFMIVYALSRVPFDTLKFQERLLLLLYR
jgi:hypothetical protein